MTEVENAAPEIDETPTSAQNGAATEESLEKELALLSETPLEDETSLKKTTPAEAAAMPPPAAQSAADRMRNLRVENLPLGILYDKENMEKKVRELFQSAFSLPEDGVETVKKVAVMDDGKETSCYVVVTFKSRVHRNRCFTQRAKLADPISVAPDTDETPKAQAKDETPKAQAKETPKAQAKETPKAEAKKTPKAPAEEQTTGNVEHDTSTENMEFVVEDEITIEDEEETAPDAKKDDADKMDTNDDLQVLENGDKAAEPEAVTEEKDSGKEEATEGAEKKEETTQSSIAPSGTSGKTGEVGGSKAGEEEHLEHQDEEEEGKEKRTFRVDWYGAPEFQWRTIANPVDRSKLTIENVSMGDLTNPFLYNAVLRARAVNFDCVQANRHGEFEHAILRKGRLVLSFVSDSQAMSAAVNTLVFVRTRENRRLKVFLPQTPSTLKMSHLLERKLGQITDPPVKASQLMIRDIGSEATEELIKEAVMKFAPEERIDKITIEEDSFKRKCGVITFKDPHSAISVHMRADEMQIGEKERWCKVFHMQDIIPGCLLMKPEQNLEKRKQFLTDSAKHRSHSKTHKKDDKSGDKSEDGDSKKRKLDEDEKKDSSSNGEKESAEVSAEKQEAKKEQSGSPDRKKAKSGGPAAALSSSWKDKGKDKSPRGGLNKSYNTPRGKSYAPIRSGDRRGGKTFPDKGRGGARSPRGGSNFRGGNYRGLDRGGSSFRGNDRGGFRGGRGGRGGGFNRAPAQQSYGRSSGGSNTSQPWLSNVNAPVSQRGYREPQQGLGMEQVLKQQQQQLEYQQQLLRQQDIINQLADELSSRARPGVSPAASAYGGGQGAPYNGPGAGGYGGSPGTVYGSSGSYQGGGGRYGRR